MIAGYTGGVDSSPSFEDVSTGKTGNIEAVKVFYQAKKISYKKLLDTYWRNIDPTRLNGQFTDEGPQFRTVIYFLDESQQAAAILSKQQLQKSGRFGKGKPLVTEILQAMEFHPAEKSHQDYFKKNSGRYHTYRLFSGRDKFFKHIWGAVPLD